MAFRPPAQCGLKALSLAVAATILVTVCGTFAAAVNNAPRSGAVEDNSVPAPCEIRFVDGSTMRVLVREARLDVQTDYGPLVIPFADIQRIEFGLRLSDENRNQIDAAIADLASTQPHRRQAASGTLLAFKEAAYPAVVRAANRNDGETARQAQGIVADMRANLSPDETLDTSSEDVVYTTQFKVVGKIKLDLLRIATLPFGEQQAKLTDLRSLRLQNALLLEQMTSAAALPDPGTPSKYSDQIGKTLRFRLVGPQPGVANQSAIYGNNIYTMDSSLATAALHAGVLRPGQTAVIRVTILGPQAGFQSATRNGVTSRAYGPFAGFRIEQRQAAAP